MLKFSLHCSLKHVTFMIFNFSDFDSFVRRHLWSLTHVFFIYHLSEKALKKFSLSKVFNERHENYLKWVDFVAKHLAFKCFPQKLLNFLECKESQGNKLTTEWRNYLIMHSQSTTFKLFNFVRKGIKMS